jgi:hypothetical protein
MSKSNTSDKANQPDHIVDLHNAKAIPPCKVKLGAEVTSRDSEEV